MKRNRFIIIIIIQIAIIGFILYDLNVFTKAPPEERLGNWETEANLPLIGKNEEYDVVMLGSSHARIFSRFNNHKRVEKVLDRSVINLSQGSERGGVKNQQIYLKYFYGRGNEAKTLIYFVDPFVFYRKSLDNNVKTYINEPYRTDFRKELELSNTDAAIVDFYVKKDKEGILPVVYPELEKDIQDTQVATLEAQAVIDRVNYLYQDAYNKVEFEATFAILLKTLDLAKRNDTRVIVIVPTTLIPEQLGDNYVYEALREESKKGTFEYYHYAHEITDTTLYYDTDHLNTEGVLYFSEKYLKPILDK